MNAYKQQRNLDILIKTCPGRNKNLHYDANKRYIFFFSSPISSPPLSFFLCFALLFLFCFVLLFFFLFSFLFFLSPSPLPFPSFYSSFPFSFPFPFPFSFPSLDPRQRRRARFRDWRVINFSVFHCSPELTLQQYTQRYIPQFSVFVRIVPQITVSAFQTAPQDVGFLHLKCLLSIMRSDQWLFAVVCTKLFILYRQNHRKSWNSCEFSIKLV